MILKAAIATIFVAAVPLSLRATLADEQNANATQAPAAAAGTPAAKKKPPVTWWLMNSKETASSVPWQFHADGTLSYMNGVGNSSGYSFDTAAHAWLRWRHWTSHSAIEVGQRNLEYAATRSSVDYVERTLREQLDYDITRNVTFVTGVEHYRNSLMFLDKRLSVYGGLASTLLQNEKHKLTFTAALGRAEYRFDRDAMLEVNRNAVQALDTNPNSGGVLGMQMWHWTVSPRLIVSENATYMQYFDSLLGHRWTIDLAGTLPIDRRLAFNLSYHVKEETNTFIHALHVFPQDRTFLMGIKVSM